MAETVHGSKQRILFGGDHVRVTTSQLDRGGDQHDITLSGDDDHVLNPGLGKGKFTCGGVYDKTAGTGPQAVIKPLINTIVEITRQVAGAGTGLPQEVFDVHLENYTETAPVADMVTWAVDATISGPVDDADQS
jgi:hypothetical protein